MIDLWLALALVAIAIVFYLWGHPKCWCGHRRWDHLPFFAACEVKHCHCMDFEETEG